MSTLTLDLEVKELELLEFYIDEDGNSEELPTHSLASLRSFYGINVSKVIEIIQIPNLTVFPNQSHKGSLGSFNLRGRIIPLINLGIWLDSAMIDTPNNKVIIVELSGFTIGFLVSGITCIHRLSSADVLAPSKHIEKYSKETITGVVRMENKILFVLDVEQIVGTMNPKLQFSEVIDDHSHEQEKQELNELRDLAAQNKRLSDAGDFKILIADDSNSIRNILSATLEKVGYVVTKTASGREALEVLTKYKNQAAFEKKSIFDFVTLIVSDIEMPEMDGHTLTRHIKADSTLAHIPVILFSSLITDAMRIKGDQVGADAQISKPDLPKLAMTTRSIIREKLQK